MGSFLVGVAAGDGYLKLGEEKLVDCCHRDMNGYREGCLFEVFFDMNKDGKQVIMQRKENYNFMGDRSRGNS